MPAEPLSPELALVDPDLAARARAALPVYPSVLAPRERALAVATPASVARAPGRPASARPYPIWARVTAALWLLVIGILIGGAAIPHAQDKPRIIPNSEIQVCTKPSTQPTSPFERFGRGRP